MSSSCDGGECSHEHHSCHGGVGLIPGSSVGRALASHESRLDLGDLDGRYLGTASGWGAVAVASSFRGRHGGFVEYAGGSNVFGDFLCSFFIRSSCGASLMWCGFEFGEKAFFILKFGERCVGFWLTSIYSTVSYEYV